MAGMVGCIADSQVAAAVLLRLTHFASAGASASAASLAFISFLLLGCLHQAACFKQCGPPASSQAAFRHCHWRAM